MAVEEIKPGVGDGKTARSEIRFPAYDLADSVAVAKSIYEKGGGSASPDALSAFLGYKSTNNGAYLARVGASRAFGLIEKNGNNFVLSSLARRVLMPTYQEDVKPALLESFFKVDLFKRIYDDFKGRELPPEFGMKNALKNTYGVTPNRVELALRVLMASADAAGMFSTRSGARTHLIIPTFSGSSAPPPPADNAATPTQSFGSGSGSGSGSGGSGGSNGGNPPTPAPATTPVSAPRLDDVKAKYVSTLIKMLEDKSANGEIDTELMQRIERLLGAT
jgi:hypothetical protein